MTVWLARNRAKFENRKTTSTTLIKIIQSYLS